MRLPRTALIAAALAPALLLPATTAFAGTVTSLADDGSAGTLRSQIAAADPGEVIVFQAGLTGTILLNSELLIQKNLTIDGPGARQLRISGGDATRVLRVSEPTAEVEIEGVTIAHGLAGGSLPFGGGLLVEAATRVRLERVSIVDNVADSGAAFPGLGGGVFVPAGELELIDSTVANNRVLDDNGTGGGLFIGIPASFEIVGSTIAANEADVGAGVTAAGAEGTIEDTTIARNVADRAGGIATSSMTADVAITRSLVTANQAATGPACTGIVTSTGRNVVDDVTGCDFTAATGDATGAPAPVGTLGDHGGPTDTVMPLLGNPALDHIPAPCLGGDQRGEDRPRGPGCDAGAVEALPARLTAAGPLVLGAALVGQQTAPASTLVTNTGEVAAVVSGVTKAGPNQAEVVGVPAADVCTDTTVLEPGAACRIQARLAPTSVGLKQATYSVALAAPGIGADIAVTGTGEPRPARLEASGPLTLGAVQVGQQSPPVTVEITNAGDVDAAITGVSLGGPNAAEVEPVADAGECTATTVLGAGMSCKLKARLAPTSVGAKQATYTVSLAGSFVEVAVTGTGDAVPQSPADPGGGSTNPSSIPQPSSAEAVLIGTRTKAGKGGKLKLRLRCVTVNAGSCVGSLTLKLGARKLTKSFAITAGQEVVVTLKLGAGDRRKLTRKRSLKSAVTVMTTQPDGTRKTTHQSSFKLLGGCGAC